MKITSIRVKTEHLMAPGQQWWGIGWALTDSRGKILKQDYQRYGYNQPASLVLDYPLIPAVYAAWLKGFSDNNWEPGKVTISAMSDGKVVATAIIPTPANNREVGGDLSNPVTVRLDANRRDTNVWPWILGAGAVAVGLVLFRRRARRR